MSGLRNYHQTKNTVKETYSQMFEGQNLKYVLEQKEHYKKHPQKIYNIFDLITRLEEVIDASDPDTDNAQINHAYQTAESIKSRLFKDDQFIDPPIRMLFKIKEWRGLPDNIRRLYQGKRVGDLFPHIKDWSWLIVVGLIHDLGKVLHLDEWGALPQWSVVGDTFPVGCSIDDSVIYPEHHGKNVDHNTYDLMGIYTPNCGFESLHMSWGHDEYLAMVLQKNLQYVKLPEEAIYMIRYHSFYPWHTPRGKSRGYTYFADLTDWKKLPLLKILQISDLYSKSADMPDIHELKKLYTKTLSNWFTRMDLSW